VVLAATRMRV